MANEVTITTSLGYSKNSYDIVLAKTGLNVTVSGTKYYSGVQTIGTSEEALSKGDIGTIGFCLFINRDATNYVSLRRATGEGNMIKLKPGEVALFRMEATAPCAIANTAACELEVLMIED